MICYEDATFDPTVTHARLAVLECLEQEHKLHCFSSVDALDAYLDRGLDEMEQAVGTRIGLLRMVLIFSTPRAVQSVATRMAPGKDFAAWPQPDAWLALYQRIEELRARARAFNPHFVPRYL